MNNEEEEIKPKKRPYTNASHTRIRLKLENQSSLTSSIPQEEKEIKQQK
jgi:nicotinic acid mononucleotide adenylyltransferase